jgi:hypothetical protein
LSIGDNLKIPHGTSIVDFDETEATFAIPARANPASNLCTLSGRLGLASFMNGNPRVAAHLILEEKGSIRIAMGAGEGT